MRILYTAALSALLSLSAVAQENINNNKFKQLGTQLPSPNVYRTASGAPGHQYWQQRADYSIEVSLDEDQHQIKGQQTVTYFNNSPDMLPYIWVQLDQNMRAKDSDTYKIREGNVNDPMSFRDYKNLTPWFDGGFKLDEVTDTKGNALAYSINKTMMRIDLPKPLVPNSAVSFRIKWHYNINDRMQIGGRSGYEMFEEENNAIYTIALLYPRMAVYSDDAGWNHKQFLGSGEFSLPFGNFDVKITVPADHVVAATGELQNTKSILSLDQLNRLAQAEAADRPVEIVTQAEAVETEKGRATATRTWHFKAENVRDFGWASSRKFIWDAQGVKFPVKGATNGERTALAMSYYPKEGNPLWGKYSTAAVAHTLRIYSKYTFDYPYPVAISVNAASIGMEYPMICFNYGRTEEDGTYAERTKYGVISVIIHEVGHNYFPMIVNSDERNWTWMDEGLNTFLQFLTEQEWERNYPSRRGEPRDIVDYMKGDKSGISPIMTQSESVHQLGPNAYGKPATALNILRETVMGRELFDFAFKTYAQRWMFKHPTPADFFRTMEDASAVDLDWFWRGWFYSTDHVDLAIDEVAWKQVGELVAEQRVRRTTSSSETDAPSITKMRNESYVTRTAVEADSSLVDFYNLNRQDDDNNTPSTASDAPDPESLEAWQRDALKDSRHYYEVSFSNVGGLPMPIILQMQFEDGTDSVAYIPAEIWRKDDATVRKVFVTEKRVTQMTLDPYLQTADVDLSNNNWPSLGAIPSRFQLFKRERGKPQSNPMQRAGQE
jgi:hypothetical protein